MINNNQCSTINLITFSLCNNLQGFRLEKLRNLEGQSNIFGMLLVVVHYSQEFPPEHHECKWQNLMMMALLKYLERGNKGGTKINKINGDLFLVTIEDQTKGIMEISQRNKP
jgi:hypothetical protein